MQQRVAARGACTVSFPHFQITYCSHKPAGRVQAHLNCSSTMGRVWPWQTSGVCTTFFKAAILPDQRVVSGPAGSNK